MASDGPLAQVLAAMQDGAHLRPDIATRTGLPLDVVDAAVEHLLRSGVLSAETLGSGCPAGGCSGCASPTGHGCSTAAARTPGPVLLTLSRRPDEHVEGTPPGTLRPWPNPTL